MRTSQGKRLGVMFDRDRAPETLAAFAREAEAAGADDLWLVEDLGWAGAMTSAAVALAATDRIRVGLGIAAAPLRNPALLAMEVAALARMFPGRFVAGIGHGVGAWMHQVGAATPHQLALLEETISAVRALVRGETVTLHGTVVHLDKVRLVHPASVVPPVVAGVVKPRSLRLSGRVAEGTVIAEGHGPEELTRVRAVIAEGQPADAPPHEMIVFTFVDPDTDSPATRAALAAMVGGQARWLGVDPADVFVAAGTAAEVSMSIRALWAAGADTVVLRPALDTPLSAFLTSLTP